jgi:hypothetical protein
VAFALVAAAATPLAAFEVAFPVTLPLFAPPAAYSAKD